MTPHAPFLLIPLCTGAATAALAGLLLARDPSRRENRLAALLVGGGSFWSACEVLWNTRLDAAQALVWMKASALAWVWIGPLVLHLLLEVTSEPMPRLRRALPWLYAGAAGLLVLIGLTPWFFTGVVQRPWGWAARLGPGATLFYAHTVGCIVLALRVAARASLFAVSRAEREQVRWLSFGIFVPFVFASTTDVLLPLAGIQLPRLGPTGYAFLAGTLLWTHQRFGYALLTPGDFAAEIVEALPDGVALVRPDGRVWSANAAMARLFERPGRSLAGVAMAERLATGLDAGSSGAEQRDDLATFSGRRVPVAVATHPLRDRRGAPIAQVVVMRDLSEVVALRERLLFSGRLAAVGELAAGIAHEINNPLAFVRANLSLLHGHTHDLAVALGKGDLETATGLLAESEELVDESLEGVDRVVGIVRDVRGLAHAGGARREFADVHRLIDGVLRMAAPQLRDPIRVERCFGAISQVRCAPQQLQQVFLNLVLNAAHAIRAGGTIRIATEPDGSDRIVVRVEDDGAGIAPEHLERVFDPFFTTKAVGEGLGLGLGIAHGIVRSHGGEIHVESRLGHGTRFSVHLPVDADTLPSSAEEPAG